MAQRDGSKPSGDSTRRGRESSRHRSILPMALIGTMTLASAAIGGALLASASRSGDGGSSVAPSAITEESMGSEQPGDVSANNGVGESSTPVSGADRESILGHFAYAEAEPTNLREVGRFNGRTERLRSAAAERFGEMQAMARQSGLELVAISGFRSTEVQETLFFQVGQSQSMTPQERALVSAPPGYSEHHTGYAIDIGDGKRPHTHLNVEFETTPAFRWLQANAARYGFELSFPKDNENGVSYEPWHWRFVGNSDSLATFYSNRPQPNLEDSQTLDSES